MYMLLIFYSDFTSTLTHVAGGVPCFLPMELYIITPGSHILSAIEENNYYY